MIYFKGRSLFGRDSSSSLTSHVLSLCTTAFIWLVFFLCMLFIKPKSKSPEYKEVKILLSSTPIEKNEGDTAPLEKLAGETVFAEDASAKQNVTLLEGTVSEQKVVSKQETVSPQKVNSEQKANTEQKASSVEKKKSPPAEKSSSSPTTPTTPTTLEASPSLANSKLSSLEPFVPSVKDMTDIDFGTKTSSSKDFDWSLFDDASSSSSATSSFEKSQKVSSSSSASGNAGSTSSSQSERQTSSSSSTSSTSKRENASSKTSAALNNIRASEFSGKASNGLESKTNVNAEKSGNGKYIFQMSGGATRLLQDPSEPKIDLSEEASATIVSDVNLVISFAVTPAGSVSSSSIQFTPASVLSELVKKEIISQLVFWCFDKSDSGEIAYASFDYHIKRK